MSNATYQDFFTAFCVAFKAPATRSNLLALAAVSIFEGPNDPAAAPARYNPFNCEGKFGTSTDWNTVGVQDYKNFTQGVAGSVAFFNGSHWADMAHNMRMDAGFVPVANSWERGYTWAKHDFASTSATQMDTRLARIIGIGPTTGVDEVTPEDIAAIAHAVMMQPVTFVDPITNKSVTTNVEAALGSLVRHVDIINIHTTPKS